LQDNLNLVTYYNCIVIAGQLESGDLERVHRADQESHGHDE